MPYIHPMAFGELKKCYKKLGKASGVCCVFWQVNKCFACHLLVEIIFGAFSYLSIWIDSKSILYGTLLVVMTDNLNYLALGLTRYVFYEISTQHFWFSIFTWLTHCTINMAYIPYFLLIFVISLLFFTFVAEKMEKLV